MFTESSLQIIINNLPAFISGLWTTIWLVSASLAIGFVIAMLCTMTIYLKIPVAREIVRVFTFIFRGTPLLIQIFFIYYGVSQVPQVRESFIWPILELAHHCALIALSLNTAAYTTEILLGCMKSTPKTEIEAAKAFGMTDMQTITRIVLPSSFRRLIPLYGNEIVFMIQGSAVVSTITIMDLTGVAKRLYATYYTPFEPFLTAGMFYFILIAVVILSFKWLENKFLKIYTRR